jgi:antitoxin (DNA-binding transcriptional repressor) of toxin-antitoxin stability system
MKAAGIREFKAKLSSYLADVRRGEIILITDRGEVVAEVRKPSAPAVEDPRIRSLAPLAARGELKLGDPSLAGANMRQGVRSGVTADRIERELEASRQDGTESPDS